MFISDMRPPLDTAAHVHAAADAGATWRDPDGRLAAVCAVCTLHRPTVALVLCGGRWFCPDEVPARARWAPGRPFVLVTDDPRTVGAYAAAVPAVPTLVVPAGAGRYAPVVAGAMAVTIGPDALPGYACARLGVRPRVYALRADWSARPDWAAVVGAGAGRVFCLPDAAVPLGRLLGRLAQIAAAVDHDRPAGPVTYAAAQLPAQAAAYAL